jgi:hypothetical protein
MGLDLICDDMHIHVGSYHTIHSMRIDWINAYIAFMREKDQNTVSFTNIDIQLSNIIRNQMIDYYNLKKINFENLIFNGLMTFVNHSDCDGTFSSQECCNILITLTIIKPYLKQQNESKFNNDIYFIEPIIIHSIIHNKKIDFC